MRIDRLPGRKIPGIQEPLAALTRTRSLQQRKILDDILQEEFPLHVRGGAGQADEAIGAGRRPGEEVVGRVSAGLAPELAAVGVGGFFFEGGYGAAAGGEVEGGVAYYVVVAFRGGVVHVVACCGV